jgi:hypothetical protein
MVGLTMVLAIAICIFGAAALFAALSRPFSDLVPIVAPAPEITVEEAPDAPTTDEPPADQPIQTEPEPTEPPSAEPTVAPAEQAFEPTHQISALTSVNFRSGPSVGDSVIVALSPATPLQYLDEDETAADGDRWMRFRNESGQDGWVLEELTEPYQP